MAKEEVGLKIELSETSSQQWKSSGNPNSSAKPATGSESPPTAQPAKNATQVSGDSSDPDMPRQKDVAGSTPNKTNEPPVEISEAHRRPAPVPAEFVEPTVESETGLTPETLASSGALAEGAAGVLLPLAVAVGASVKALDIFSDTVHALDSSFQDMIRRGSQYNPQVGLAAELGELKIMFAEMRRANKLESGLADYALARADLSVEIKNLTTSVSQLIIPYMKILMTGATGILRAINTVADKLPDTKSMENGLFSYFETYFDTMGMGETLRIMREWYQANNADKLRDEIENFDSMWQRFTSPQPFVGHKPNATKFR